MSRSNLMFEKHGERNVYIRPEIGYVVLEDASMTFTSWVPHQKEPVIPVYEEGDDGVVIPDAPKGVKAFSGWDIPDDDFVITDDDADVAFGLKKYK